MAHARKATNRRGVRRRGFADAADDDVDVERVEKG
jgi:hypothetical protein